MNGVAMGLLAAIAVFVLAPQDPSTTPAAPTPAAALQAQEGRGRTADPRALAELALGDDAVAERAAWLLAKTDGPTTLPALHTVVTAGKSAVARTHAMAGLLTRRRPDSDEFTRKALQDSDRRVRTLAAQLVAITQPRGARADLIALIERAVAANEPGVATDVQAALVALHDLRSPDGVVALAQTIGGSTLQGCGDALAYLCQEFVPKLPTDERMAAYRTLATHREEAVRRVALNGLSAYRDPQTIALLQQRAAAETGPLQPLAAAALATATQAKAPADADLVAQAKHNAKALAAAVTGWWAKQSLARKSLAIAAPATLLVIGVTLLLVVRNRRRMAAEQAAAAAEAIALVQPSDEYLERAEAEAEQFAASAEQVADEIGLPLDDAATAEADANWNAHAPSAR